MILTADTLHALIYALIESIDFAFWVNFIFAVIGAILLGQHTYSSNARS